MYYGIFLGLFVLVLLCSFFLLFSLFFNLCLPSIPSTILPSRVGNTGIPGVWLFHTGNSYSFDNIVPAAVVGLLATPPPRGHGLPLVLNTSPPTQTHTCCRFCFNLQKEQKADSLQMTPRTPLPLSTLSLRYTQTTHSTLKARTRRKRKRTTTL